MPRHQLPDYELSEDATMRIQMRRRRIWKDTSRAFKEPGFTPCNGLKVNFIGEAAIDDGGPQRELF